MHQVVFEQDVVCEPEKTRETLCSLKKDILIYNDNNTS